MMATLVGVAETDPNLDPSRLHPTLRQLVSAATGDIASLDAASAIWGTDRFQLAWGPTGKQTYAVLVRTAEPISGARYASMAVRAQTGTIAAVGATLSQLIELASDPNVIYIEPSWKTEIKLDQSVQVVRADLAHSGAEPSLGEGVVVGIVDTGIDYEHLDFRIDVDGDGFEESTRIHAIWDQTAGLFGAVYSRAHIDNDLALGFGPSEGLVRSTDRNGHGTHVASIATGDGSAASSPFVGVAPAATVIIVKTSFYTADILSAVEWIFDEADALGLPAVVNLSLGGHDGPHDGTSLFEEGLDQLANSSGRAIVVSAGNEGDQPIHTSGSLSGTYETFGIVPDDWEMELAIWYPGSSSFSVSITPPGGTPIRAATGEDTGYITTTAGTLSIDNASAGVNPSNGDNEAFIRLSNVQAGEVWAVQINDLGGGGKYDAWVVTPDGSILGGDSVSTIDEPGNGHHVITVGSMNSKASWPSLSGQQDHSDSYPLGHLSGFSSRGPTRDGRLKPEICAPGAWVCAAASSNAPQPGYLMHPDGMHVMEIGSSMASPHVAGAIALLFEHDRSLTPTEIRTVLTTTAASNAYTASLPGPGWGWGLLDVMSAIESVASVEPPEPPTPLDRPSISLVANPVSQTARFAFDIPEGASYAQLRVYTVAGSLVREAEVAPTGGEYVWNLTTDHGGSLAVGLYLYVLVTDIGASDVGRMVIQR